jgi:hypothetical protein
VGTVISGTSATSAKELTMTIGLALGILFILLGTARMVGLARRAG